MSMIYKLKFLPTALKEWKKLDNSIQAQFKKKLKENKWIGIGGIALKPFIVKYRGHIEEGNNYVEWKAIFKENLPKWDQN